MLYAHRIGEDDFRNTDAAGLMMDISVANHNGKVPSHPYYTDFKATEGFETQSKRPYESDFDAVNDFLKFFGIMLLDLKYDEDSVKRATRYAISAYLYGAGIDLNFTTLWEYHTAHAHAVRGYLQDMFIADTDQDSYAVFPLSSPCEENVVVSWLIGWLNLLRGRQAIG